MVTPVKSLSELFQFALPCIIVKKSPDGNIIEAF